MQKNKNGAPCGNTDSAKNTGLTITKARNISLSQPERREQTRQQEISEKIMHLLPCGKENAVSMWELSLVLNMSERQTRKAVFDARQSGAIICGDNSGYYRPETRSELQRYYFRARKRAKSCFSSLQAAKRALEDLDGQEKLREVG